MFLEHPFLQLNINNPVGDVNVIVATHRPARVVPTPLSALSCLHRTVPEHHFQLQFNLCGVLQIGPLGLVEHMHPMLVRPRFTEGKNRIFLFVNRASVNVHLDGSDCDGARIQVWVCGVAKGGWSDHDEPLIGVVAAISVVVHVFPRFLRAQVVVVRHSVSVVVVNASISVAVKLRQCLFVRTRIDQVGNAVVIPVVQATVPVCIVLGKRRLRRTRIVRVEHPVPIVVVKTRGVTLNTLHRKSKPDRIPIQPDGALRATWLDEACNNINVDVRRSVEITPGYVDTDNGLVARGKRRCVVGVHHLGVEFSWCESTRPQSVGQQNRPVLKADAELKVVHHSGFRLGRKRHADAHILAVHQC